MFWIGAFLYFVIIICDSIFLYENFSRNLDCNFPLSLICACSLSLSLTLTLSLSLPCCWLAHHLQLTLLLLIVITTGIQNTRNIKEPSFVLLCYSVVLIILLFNTWTLTYLPTNPGLVFHLRSSISRLHSLGLSTGWCT